MNKPKKRTKNPRRVRYETITVKMQCKSCPGCGSPCYIDGCLDCGYGIDGWFPQTSNKPLS